MSYEPVSATNLPKSAITDLAEKVALEFGYDHGLWRHHRI
jgi:hypothetical protein